jgi:hypothetical protein
MAAKNDINKDISVVPFFKEEDKRAASVSVLRNIFEVMFFYMEEEEGDMDGEELEEFTDYIWRVVCAGIASTNMNIIGKDENGRYIAVFEPYSSVKEFLIKEDSGMDGHVFYEDIIDPLGLDSGFGLHDKKMTEITEL